MKMKPKPAENKRIRGSTLVMSGLAPMEDLMKSADERGLVIASNARLAAGLKTEFFRDGTKKLVPSLADNILRRVALSVANYSIQNLPDSITSGTVFAYVEPDRTLREAGDKLFQFDGGWFVVYNESDLGKRWFFPIPEEHLDKKDVILAIDYPDYELKIEGNSRIISPRQNAVVRVIENFPTRLYCNIVQPTMSDEFKFPSVSLDDAKNNLNFSRHIGRAVAFAVQCTANQWLYTNIKPSISTNVLFEAPNEVIAKMIAEGKSREQIDAVLKPLP
ncbi:MAG: hypothetical protein Q7S22_02320 [Candidatus Micrarchaeota archaeon]|nr:hypothetical protein [Candidatus Micrarchaeota archaeon]